MFHKVILCRTLLRTDFHKCKLIIVCLFLRREKNKIHHHLPLPQHASLIVIRRCLSEASISLTPSSTPILKHLPDLEHRPTLIHCPLPRRTQHQRIPQHPKRIICSPINFTQSRPHPSTYLHQPHSASSVPVHHSIQPRPILPLIARITPHSPLKALICNHQPVVSFFCEYACTPQSPTILQRPECRRSVLE